MWLFIKNTILMIVIASVVFAIFPMKDAYCQEAIPEHNGYIVKMKKQTRTTYSLENDSILSKAKSCGNDIYVVDDKEKAQSLSAQAEYIEPNYKVELMDTYYYDTYQEQTIVNLTNVNAVWNIGCYGNDVKVGVIDSGVYEHNALTGNLLDGYNYLSNNNDTTDNIGHGTKVSGIIAAKYGYDMIGIAHQAKIVPLKCFDVNATTYLNTIISAIDGAVNDFNCDIVNLSLGVLKSSLALEESINYATSKGVMFVAAVGNNGNDTLYYPASCDAVIGVASVNTDKSKSTFSNYNNSVFVTAPGNNIYSLGNTGGYASDSGTSFSTPVVTGVIATMLSIDNTLDVNSVKTILSNTSEDLGVVGYDTTFGHGLVDEENIMSYMLSKKDYFVSPIDIQNEGFAEVRVWKNSIVSSKPIGIWANYDGGRMINTKIVNLLFRDSNVEIFKYYSDFLKLKYFLWGSLNNSTPLSVSRIVN